MPDSLITKKALAGAFKELTRKYPFEKITVKDICESCGMNRKSFYYHFRDKYDLANWIFEHECMSGILSAKPCDIWELMRELCCRLHENRQFYVNLLQYRGQDCFQVYFTEALRPVLRDRFLITFGGRHDELGDFFADAILVSAEKWILERPEVLPVDYVNQLRAPIDALINR